MQDSSMCKKIKSGHKINVDFLAQILQDLALHARQFLLGCYLLISGNAMESLHALHASVKFLSYCMKCIQALGMEVHWDGAITWQKIVFTFLLLCLAWHCQPLYFYCLWLYASLFYSIHITISTPLSKNPGSSLGLKKKKSSPDLACWLCLPPLPCYCSLLCVNTYCHAHL